MRKSNFRLWNLNKLQVKEQIPDSKYTQLINLMFIKDLFDIDGCQETKINLKLSVFKMITDYGKDWYMNMIMWCAEFISIHLGGLGKAWLRKKIMFELRLEE